MKNIKTTLSEFLNEWWYHGTPDAREIEKESGFTDRNITVDYVTDPIKFNELQQDMTTARENDNMTLYRELINKVSDFKADYTYKKPVFLSDSYQVAKTYANPQRAFDYQNSIEKVYEVDVKCNKIVEIVAIGERFRFINVKFVKKRFVDAGVQEEEIDKLISMFNYYVSENSGIKTDVIGAIGNWLGFDCIDVVGVLDSYHGGKIKSTVRMVLNPSDVKIIK